MLRKTKFLRKNWFDFVLIGVRNSVAPVTYNTCIAASLVLQGCKIWIWKRLKQEIIRTKLFVLQGRVQILLSLIF